LLTGRLALPSQALDASPATVRIRLRQQGGLAKTIRQARRLIVLVVGLTLLLCGVVMLVTPGPGLLLIFAGLTMLALEFLWARRLLRKIKARSRELGWTMFDSHKK
jgi:uncharacterized protein (TIGR02611 family)